MTYLIVGVDRPTLVPWHRNVLAPDPSTAGRIARRRAADEGVALVVAAVIGAGGQVVPQRDEARDAPVAIFPAARAARG